MNRWARSLADALGVLLAVLEILRSPIGAAVESVRVPGERGALLAHPYQEMMPMSAHTITLELPASLYDYFEGRAQKTRRSLEAEVLDAVAASTPIAESLSPELEEALVRLEKMGEDELWQTARCRLTSAESRQLEELNLRQHEDGLGDAERAELAELLSKYEVTILLRAEAARRLAERGHEISQLLIDPAA